VVVSGLRARDIIQGSGQAQTAGQAVAKFSKSHTAFLW